MKRKPEKSGKLGDAPLQKKKKKVKPVKEKAGKIVKEVLDDDGFLNAMQEWKKHGLRKEILKALFDKGFLKPTKIQQKCIHAAMTSKKSDIVGAAETGSGKTYAFGIPIVQEILAARDEKEFNE